MAEQQRLVLNLSDFPISEVQSRNVEGIRSYARSVRNKHAYGAASVLFFIANQIEAQTKPARIPEPGPWGVVEASCVHSGVRGKWLHHEDGNWYLLSSSYFGTAPGPDDWDSLVDPTLVRPGVDD